MAYLLQNTTQVVSTLERTAQSIKDDVNVEFKNLNTPISYDQWMVLNTISKEEGLTQIEISRACRKEPASICRTMKVLKREGLVSLFSDLSNKKSHKVKLSRKGRDLVAKSSHLVEKVSQKVLESLFDRELNMFTSLLQRIQARA